MCLLLFFYYVLYTYVALVLQCCYAVIICSSCLQLFRRFKPLFQICDDVVDVLCADGQPDRSREDALVSQFFLCKLGVCRCRRVDDQALDVRNIGQQ